jgi:hypothetical protein
MGKSTKILKKTIVGGNPKGIRGFPKQLVYKKNCKRCSRLFNPTKREKICYSCFFKRYEEKRVKKIHNRLIKSKKLLGRFCKSCEKRFIPTGKFARFCEDCLKEIHKKADIKRILAHKNKTMQRVYPPLFPL